MHKWGVMNGWNGKVRERKDVMKKKASAKKG